ncbi:hypothetical protein TWF481_007691 [Arthrobotrys musiformis]|uniref:Uncharacterized protein n=1 Tax=Arthrobotrys musiformis TaxID=47236 RepID=A0AAV9WC94_9PEZI
MSENSSAVLLRNDIRARTSTAAVQPWTPSGPNNIRDSSTESPVQLGGTDAQAHDDIPMTDSATRPLTPPLQDYPAAPETETEAYNPMLQWLDQSSKEDPWAPLNQTIRLQDQRPRLFVRVTRFHPRRS